MSSIDWTSYAQVYDLMAEHNPSYRNLLELFREELKGWELPPGGPIVDLGSGTGNFSLAIARRFPARRVLGLDSDPGMNEASRAKAEREGLENLQLAQADLETLSLKPGSVSGIVCVHALYTLSDPVAVIRRMYDWLRPGGLIFVCDIGRVLDVADWSVFMFRALKRRLGLKETLRVFYRGRGVMKQNRLIAAAQKSARFWTHAHAEFRKSFGSAGFELLRSSVAYRGYSDVLVGRKETRSGSTARLRMAS